MNNPTPAGSRWLDAAVVVFALMNVTLFGAALAFLDIPDGNLPILASIGTALLGVVTGYAVWRFKTPSNPTPDPVPAIDPGPPPNQGSGGSPPPPQTINVVHMMGEPPTPSPPTTA